MKLPLKQIAIASGVLLLVMILAYAWQKTSHQQKPHSHDEAGEHHVEESAPKIEKGTHGGRLFRDDNFALEVKIFEEGVDPQLRLYAFDKNTVISPKDVQAQVVITRLDATQTLSFRPEADYLLGDAIVYEPHSFAVQVKASYAGKNYVFDWQQEEGRLTLPTASLASSGIELLRVLPQTLADGLSLQGEVQIRPERDVAVLARVAGVVVSINKPLGSTVKQGDVLAVLESRELATLRASLYSAQQRLILAQEHFHHQDTLLQQNMIPEHEYVSRKPN
jgi:cobalt-zinc-cadmium efflux system membrane fusion protein